jgi:GNAT superfamily N-acetyltransferase
VTDYKNLIIEPLNTSHDRPGFQCGESSLDEYIKKQAKQDVKRRVSRVFVARELDKPGIILAYYTLSTLSIELPPPLARKLPRHPIPAALIGRLAVSQQVQGYGVGRMLVADAIKRILGVSNEIAIYAVVVDALNEGARRFYQQFGFVPLNVHSRRLFIPLKSL